MQKATSLTSASQAKSPLSMRQVFILAAILLPCALFAEKPLPDQIPARNGWKTSHVHEISPSPLPDNYQVTLTCTQKNGELAEVAIVIAGTHFSATLMEPKLLLDGRVTIEDSGEITLNYTLGWDTREPSQTMRGSYTIDPCMIAGSVRLKLGQEVQVFRAGGHMMRLSIKKLTA
jgi:hypothetical protein